MVVVANELATIEPPALPPVARDYNVEHSQQHNNILRLYFNRLRALLSAILDTDAGGRYLYNSCGEFHDLTNQATAVINTEYAAALGTTELSNSVSVSSSSRIAVAHVGIYAVSATLNVGTSSSTTDTITVWLRKNGSTDLAGTAKKLLVDGDRVVSLRSNVSFLTTDYVEVVWAASSTDISLKTTAASSPYPAIPSTAVSVNFVSNV